MIIRNKIKIAIFFLSLVIVLGFSFNFATAQSAAELKDKINDRNSDISKLEQQIKENKIEQNKQAIAQSIMQINEIDLESILQNLLSQDTLSEVWNEVQSLKS